MAAASSIHEPRNTAWPGISSGKRYYAYTNDGMVLRLVYSARKRNGDIVWTVDHGNVQAAAVFLTEGFFYKRAGGTRVCAEEYKKADIKLIDKKLNPNTTEFIVDYHFRGNPAQLAWQRMLLHTGQYFPLPNRAEFSRVASELKAQLHEFRIDAAKRLAAMKGVRGVQRLG